MNGRETVLAQINHQETERVPFTIAFEHEVREQLNEHFGNEDWDNDLYPFIGGGGWILSPKNEKIDEDHYKDTFGAIWHTEGGAPAVVKPALEKPSFDGYTFPTVDDFFDPEKKEAIREDIEKHPNTFTTVHTGLCLWESWYLRGFENTLMDCAVEEEFYGELLDRFTDLTIELIEKCRDLPADAIMMGDDWGEQRGIMIGPERWRKFFKPRYAKIFKAVHKQGKKTIMHCCGSFAEILDDITEIGLDVIESVQPEAAHMNPYELKEKWGDRITYWGCLGSQSTIPNGTPEEIRTEIRKLRSEMSKGGGFILAPAKPLRVETPLENSLAIIDEFLKE